jgi:hypothetical protein
MLDVLGAAAALAASLPLRQLRRREPTPAIVVQAKFGAD